MTDEHDEDWLDEDQPMPLPRRRRAPIVLAVLAGLVLAGGGAALVWMNLDGVGKLLLGHEQSGSAEPASGDKAMLTDMLATQQKTSEDLETLKGDVANQEEQLKTIVDQLAALTSRLEELRSNAAVPPPSPPPAATAPPDVRAQVVPKAAKKPAKKPSGPISVGGAPLTAPPPR